MRTSRQPAQKNGTETTADDKPKNALDPRKLFDSLSAVCGQEDEAAKRLEAAPPCTQEEPSADPSKPAPDVEVEPDQERHTIKRKKSKHKEQVKKQAEWSFYDYFFMYGFNN